MCCTIDGSDSVNPQHNDAHAELDGGLDESPAATAAQQKQRKTRARKDVTVSLLRCMLIYATNTAAGFSYMELGLELSRVVLA